MATVEFELKVMSKYKSKRNDARNRGLDFDLSFQSVKNLMLAKRCAYTGITLTDPIDGSPVRGSDRTIDRVDASKGYVRGNVVACCHAINHMKGQVECSLDGTGLMGLKMVKSVFDKTIKRIEKG
jgi:hypothetical protein